MLSQFFIKRPIFAAVISLLFFITGAIAVWQLPITEYPEVVPPTVVVTANYPGANPKVIAETVASPLEQEINGVENMLYMSSQATSDGRMTLTVTFAIGTDVDLAQTQVQSRVERAKPRLPQEVQRLGVVTEKSSPDLTMVVHLTSPDQRYDMLYLSNYAALNVKDELARIEGVGAVRLFGAGDYSMRIWLDPNKVSALGLSPAQITAAIREQNQQAAAGSLGAQPSGEAEFQLLINVKGRLAAVEEFENIIIKVGANGEVSRLKDVARVELGASTYALRSLLNNKDAVAIPVFRASGSNAIQISDDVRAKMAELAKSFPDGLAYDIVYDPTVFVRGSIEAVVKTLLEAVLLVVLVVVLFLQTWRASIIPLVAVPVSLVGTFAFMQLMGFSLNALSLFGLVLAIGIVVDDAIVVVENVERVMSEEGLSPKEATKKSMGQIQGALVGIALVLSAVLLPMAFFGGSTGVIYKQFSITIVSAMVLSVLVALIFTPALCATLLKPIHKGEGHAPKRGFFGWFNRSFDRSVQRYERGVASMLRHKAPYLLAYLLIVVGMVVLFTRIPTAFLPEEDQGVLFAQVQTPAGSSAGRTQAVVDQMRSYLLEDEGDTVSSVFTVTGFNFAGRGQSSGMAFIMLKPWGQRSAENNVFNLAQRAQMHFFSFRDAMVFAFAPPAVLELGNASGFDVFLQDRAGVGHEQLLAARNQFLGMAAQSKILAGVRPNGLNDEPQYQLSIDDERASALGVTMADINNTLSIALGGSYANDFIDRGRVKKVYIQGQPNSRMSPEDLNKWYVRNSAGEMVPFSAFASGSWIFGAPKLSRFNGVESMEILGTPAPGYSSGEAMAEVERLARQLPKGIGFAWTGLSYEERLSGSQAPALYALSLLMVFLCLAALYESWSIPIAVMLVVPLGIVGALLATSLRGLSNDVYFQVGLLTTIGLAAKNAILIVEFAKELHSQGRSLQEAAIEACRMRLRPIIMTSLAFILGVVPLASATGAGSGSQHAIGTGVIGGMLTATVLAIFWVPLFFVVVSAWFSKKQPSNSHEEASQ